MKSISLFLVDDHELLRLGLREALAIEPDLEIVGEADRLEGTAARIVEIAPDVAILDIRLSDGSGIELCRQVLEEAPDIRCLMFTFAADLEPLHHSILAGAAGYVLKSAHRGEVINAVRTVAEGRSLIDPAMTEQVLAGLRSQSNEPADQLTEQERRVLDLMGEGLTNKEIATSLHLADQTVKNYVSRVLTKLDMRRTRAALYSAGLKPPSDQD